MKLWNKALAGRKLALSSGPLEVGADGSVEVADENIAKALLNSGFQSEESGDKPKAAPRPPASQPVVETPKAPEPEPEAVAPEAEEDEEDEELEIEDLAEYNAKDALALVNDTEDLDILDAWKTSETENKNRKSVLSGIEARISEVS